MRRDYSSLGSASEWMPGFRPKARQVDLPYEADGRSTQEVAPRYRYRFASWLMWIVPMSGPVDQQVESSDAHFGIIGDTPNRQYTTVAAVHSGVSMRTTGSLGVLKGGSIRTEGAVSRYGRPS